MSVVRKPNRRPFFRTSGAVPPETAVALNFRHPAPGDRHLRVAVHDLADGALLFDATPAETGDWLRLRGFRYVAGSDAIWLRDAAAPPLAMPGDTAAPAAAP